MGSKSRDFPPDRHSWSVPTPLPYPLTQARVQRHRSRRHSTTSSLRTPPTHTHTHTRTHAHDEQSALKDEEFDILVIGGGATGAGVALDATTRGLRVALVEAEDFAAGECVGGRRMARVRACLCRLVRVVRALPCLSVPACVRPCVRACGSAGM